jgi:hypothetical protein
MSNLGQQFDKAQRHHDNQLPEPDPPEPKDAAYCLCGEYPVFEFETNSRAVRLLCPKCQRRGKHKWGRINAVEDWNSKIAALKEKNL